jgi:hypothetical protein
MNTHFTKPHQITMIIIILGLCLALHFTQHVPHDEESPTKVAEVAK